MKILLPTDFSACAKKAFDAALQFCKQLEGQLILFHNISLPENWEIYVSNQEQKNELISSISSYVDSSLGTLKVEAQNQNIASIQRKAIGVFIDNIIGIADEINPSLIIMGSHGASGKSEWFLGSNAQKVVRRVKHDVLIVKEQIPNHLDRITFVTDLSLRDQQSFVKLLAYAKKLSISKIDLLCIDTSNWFTQPRVIMDEAFKDFQNLAIGFECNSHFYPDYSIDAGVRHFISEKDVNFIAISNYHTNPLKRLFLGSNVEMLVNHSKAAVLAIHSN